MFIHLQLSNRHEQVCSVLNQLISDFGRQRLNNKIFSSFDLSLLDLNEFGSKLGCTSLLYHSREI